MAKKTTLQAPPIEYFDPDELEFDPQNPRLAEFPHSASASEEEMIELLWETMDVQEIVASIAVSGFFTHEPLIVVREKGHNYVHEGNRRLAAVKVIRNPKLAAKFGWSLPKISQRELRTTDQLPAIVTTREASWRYLGFRHVNGPVKWSSIAKARYIADVHHNYGVPLAEIASQLGDKFKTVERLYRGLMVLEQAQRAKVFDYDDRYHPRFALSTLYTGLDYEGISTFLGIRTNAYDSRNPVPKQKLHALREYMRWLFGSRSENVVPVVRKQNPFLRQLDAVVGNAEALAALRSGRSLEESVELTEPATSVFEETLFRIKRDLTKARSLASAGDDKTDSLLKTADDIFVLADELLDDMARRRRPSRRARSSEG